MRTRITFDAKMHHLQNDQEFHRQPETHAPNGRLPNVPSLRWRLPCHNLREASKGTAAEAKTLWSVNYTKSAHVSDLLACAMNRYIG